MAIVATVMTLVNTGKILKIKTASVNIHKNVEQYNSNIINNSNSRNNNSSSDSSNDSNSPVIVA